MTKLKVNLHGEEIQIHYVKNKTLLRALIDEGYKPPYSCEGGVCGTCVCKLNKGNVEMRKNKALDRTRLQQAYIFSCQSIALTDEIELIFE